MKLVSCILLLASFLFSRCESTNVCADYSYIKGNRSATFERIELSIDSLGRYEYTRHTGNVFGGSLNSSEGTWERKLNKIYLHETDGDYFHEGVATFKIKNGELCDHHVFGERCLTID